MFNEVGLYASQALLILVALFSVFKDWEDFKRAKTGRLTPVAVLVFTILAGVLAIQQTHSQIDKERKASAESTALTKQVGMLQDDNKNLQIKLDASNRTLQDIYGIQHKLAIPWLNDRNVRNQEVKDKRKAVRLGLTQLIGVGEMLLSVGENVGPPGSGGANAEEFLSSGQAWTYGATEYVKGTLDESHVQRFLFVHPSQVPLALDSNLNPQYSEAITRTVHQMMGQLDVLKQFLSEIPPQ